MTYRKAILDLGTNTFHLLIVETQSNGHFTELLRERRYVKLAEGGIDHIGEDSWNRGIAALKDLVHLIASHHVSETIAIGTAALRTATNGPAFLAAITYDTGIEVQVIDGQKEAQLIYQGVAKIWIDAHLPALIMDIGGGSVEFIIANRSDILWSASFPIGVAILQHRFHRSDPISSDDIEQMRCFLASYFSPLKEALSLHQPLALVGASGTFDVIQDFLDDRSEKPYTAVELAQVSPHLASIRQMDLLSRKLHPLIPQNRIDMIVVAVILIEDVLALYPFTSMGISKYALKEGLV